jgi:hypothetical protein
MAGTAISSKQVVAYEEPCLFRDNEFQVDAFGLGYFNQGGNTGNYYGVNPAPGLSGRPMWGGGLGLNYFFMKYFGIGIEQSVFGRSPGEANNYGDAGMTRWATIGNLFFRYPICQWNLAPYVMVGGGAIYGKTPTSNFAAGAIPGTGANRRGTFNSGQGVGHVGGGLEYRLTENIGLFTDARYMFSGVSSLPNNNLMWRYGLRFAF